MFSSGNTNDPFSYTNEALFGNSFANEANPNSSQHEPSSLFFPLPSPLPGETPAEGSGAKAINNINTGTEHMGIKDCPKKTSTGPPNPHPTRKTGRKDRHSKICTAHGLRDRRMRLSVQTARKFFDLQDMLGFDKASETIEWLFSKSKPAIREAARNQSPVKGGCSSGRKSALFSSKCDDGSDMEESGHEEDGETERSDISTFVAERNSIRKSRRRSCGENGSSEIARTGARERRREKLITMSIEEPDEHLLSNPNNLEQFHWCPLESPSDLDQLGRPWSPFETADEWMMGSTDNSKQYLDGNPSDLEQLGPWSPFETADESCSNSHERNSAVGLVAHAEEPTPHSVEHQLATMGMFETFLGTASSSTLPSVFDLQNNLAASDGEESNNTFLGTLECWDMHCERINPNYCPTNMDPIYTGNIIQEQNPNPTSSFDFESHFMGSIFSCSPFDGNDRHSPG